MSLNDGTTDQPVHQLVAGGDGEEPNPQGPAGAEQAAAGSEGLGATGDYCPLPPHPCSGRYVVKSFHARGGVGEVWLAEDAEIGREVALKRLRKKGAEHQERFLVEAQITGQLEHPAIVPVHDLATDEEGQPFYIMTFVRGRTLKEAIEEYHGAGSAPGVSREVQRLRLLAVFVQVCHAVAYAHSRGVVHRDLKPDNVMLGPYGETFVLDWGMAKVLTQTEKLAETGHVHPTYSSGSTDTCAGSVLGTPAYMAPEQAEGHAAEADERTDVYLLGATLYAILTGCPPRQGRSHEEMADLARTVPPVPPRKLRADVPRALEAICLQAMAYRKTDRHASALALADDVQRYLAGEPVSAYREPLRTRAWRWCKRHRTALGRSAAAVLLVCLSLFGACWVQQAKQNEEAARQEADRLQCNQKAREHLDWVRAEVEKFRRLADEMHFYAASTDPVGEHAPYYDPQRGVAAGEAALRIAEPLRPELERLQLPDASADLQKELPDVLLLLVQTRSQQSPGPQAARNMLALLEEVSSLAGPSRSYHRLRSRCYRLLGDGQTAAEEQQRAENPELSATALDYFLEGEQHRTEATGRQGTPGESVAGRPDAQSLNRAIEDYQKALRIKPNAYWYRFQLGRCYLAVGRGPEAVAALDACVALRPDVPWGYCARGLAQGLLGHFDEAEQDLQQALTLEPDFRPALLNRGVVFRLQKKYDQALDDFAAVLRPPVDQCLIEACYYRGQLYLERQDDQKALDDFNRVVAERPVFRPVYLTRAQVHFLKGRRAEGLADLTTFLALAGPAGFDPDGAEAFAQRGRLLRRLVTDGGLPPAVGLEVAAAQLKQAVKQRGCSAGLFDDLGTVLAWQGKPQEALEAYTQALPTAPAALKVKVLLKRGWISVQSLERPDYDRAQADFAEAAGLDPTNAEAHTGLGYLQACRRSQAGAQEEAAQALLHGSEEYLIVHNTACIYAQLSQIDKGREVEYQDMAMTLLRRAVELWRCSGTGPSEIELIKQEPALPRSLRDRPDFAALMAN